MSEQTSIRPRLKTARALSVVAAVLSVAATAVLLLSAFGTFSVMQTIVADPSVLDISPEDASSFAAAVAELGFGDSVSFATAIAGSVGLTAMFLFFGAVMCLFSLVASVAMVRHAKNQEHGYRTHVLAVIGAIVSFLSLRFVTGALITAAAWQVHKDFTSIHGTSSERDLGANGHMGVMRAIQVYCVFAILANMAILLFVTKSSYYDAAYWVSFIQLIAMAVVLWLLWNKKQHAREIILGVVAAFMVLDLAVQLATGTFAVGTYVDSAIFPACMLVYFATSKRAKAVLNQPFETKSRQELLAEDEKLWNLKSPLFWRNLLLYFCIFSVVGHWMEWCVCWLIRWGIVPGEYDPNSGIWHDMLNPFFVYGLAVVFIGLLLFPLKNLFQRKLPGKAAPLVASFVVNTLFCSAIELAMGLALNYPPDPVTGKLPLWDYTNMDFNFMGQICLLNSAFFGVMATLVTWLVYPNLEKAFARIPKDIMNIITVVVVVFFALVVCMYVININLAELNLPLT